MIISPLISPLHCKERDQVGKGPLFFGPYPLISVDFLILVEYYLEKKSLFTAMITQIFSSNLVVTSISQQNDGCFSIAVSSVSNVFLHKGNVHLREHYNGIKTVINLLKYQHEHN